MTVISPSPDTEPVEGCPCGADAQQRDAEGFCGECGRRWNPERPAAPMPAARDPEHAARDHVEIVLATQLAAVSDRGYRHAHNQDDTALGLEVSGPTLWRILVVCDGVSRSHTPHHASRAAATAARDALVHSLGQNTDGAPFDPEAVMRSAIAAAQRAVCGLDDGTQGEPELSKTGASVQHDSPATTIVAALASDATIVLGWVGDSRAYWLDSGGAQLLTRDHSWFNAVVDAGEMSADEARSDPLAHAITRCLGHWDAGAPEDVPEAEPDVRTVPLTSPGLLLLCSDGFWNEISAPAELAAMFADHPAEPDALNIGRTLVEFALQQGGRDNITVALALLGANENTQ